MICVSHHIKTNCRYRLQNIARSTLLYIHHPLNTTTFQICWISQHNTFLVHFSRAFWLHTCNHVLHTVLMVHCFSTQLEEYKKKKQQNKTNNDKLQQELWDQSYLANMNTAEKVQCPSCNLNCAKPAPLTSFEMLSCLAMFMQQTAWGSLLAQEATWPDGEVDNYSSVQ